MNSIISVFVICVEAIIYFLLFNLHDCTFKNFFSKCDQIRRKLRIWLHLLKKSLMKNSVLLCSDHCHCYVYTVQSKPLNLFLKKNIWQNWHYNKVFFYFMFFAKFASAVGTVVINSSRFDLIFKNLKLSDFLIFPSDQSKIFI